jgi:arabinose-5-phosphate isomerase
MSSVNEKPQVNLNTSIKDVIIEISEKRLGVTAVVENGKVEGIITDGDLRRMLSENDNFSALKAEDIMSAHPKTINENAMAVDAKEVFESYQISQLIVVNNGTYAGVVHVHDLITEGIL